MKSVSTTLASIVTALSLLCTPNSFAGNEKLDLDISSAKIEISSNQFSSKEEELVAHLSEVVKDYYVISKEDWTHKYNHVATSDSTGNIVWSEDSSKVWQWLIRPGGLATVTDENGITNYLAEVVN